MALVSDMTIEQIFKRADAVRTVEWMITAVNYMNEFDYKLSRTENGQHKIILYKDDDDAENYVNNSINNFYFNSKQEGILYTGKNYSNSRAVAAVEKSFELAKEISEYAVSKLTNHPKLDNSNYTINLLDEVIVANANNQTLFLNYPKHIEKYASDEVKNSFDFAVSLITSTNDIYSVKYLSDSIRENPIVLQLCANELIKHQYREADYELKKIMTPETAKALGSGSAVEFIEKQMETLKSYEEVKKNVPLTAKQELELAVGETGLDGKKKQTARHKV